MAGGIVIPGDYDDWRWTASAASPPSSPADLRAVNGTSVLAWTFTNGEALNFPDQQIPHDYLEGSDIVTHLHWCPTTTATYTGTWTLEIVDWLSVATGSAIQAIKTTTIAFNSAMTAWQCQTADFSAVLSGTNRKISSCLHARLSLALSAGTSCQLIGLDGHYLKDRLGSTQIATK